MFCLPAKLGDVAGLKAQVKQNSYFLEGIYPSEVADFLIITNNYGYYIMKFFHVTS